MKTVKIKVEISQADAKDIEAWLVELEWIWNKARGVALHNHCIEWYKWASKKAKDKKSEFYKVSLEGCILTPLRFSKGGGWLGATCQIGVGGNYFKNDPNAKPVKFTYKGKTKYKPAKRLVAGDNPYKAIEPSPHAYRAVGDKSLKKVLDLDSKTRLNAMRESEGLPPLTVPSDYIGGMLKDFEASWKAYLDVSLSDRKQPRFKDGKDTRILTLSNAQTPPRLKDPQTECPYFVCAGKMAAVIADKNWQQRLGSLVPRSYKLIKKPSGYYLCISAATEAEALKPTLRARKNKRSGAIKKANKGSNKARLDEIKANDAEYQELSQDLANLETLIELERFEGSPCRKTTGRNAGIDPGVVSIVTTSEGHQFAGNHKRDRVDQKIKDLQYKLDTMRSCNDRRTGKAWKRGERDATKNEIKLQGKISRLHERASNMGKAYNHKLSTRLARMYDSIAWEDTQLKNMTRRAQPKLAEGGTHYERNSGSAKTGLNRSLRGAAIGDLKAKTKQKIVAARKAWHDVPAPNTSRLCNTCHTLGDRLTQAEFRCTNPECKDFGIPKNADVNAACNIRDYAQVG